MTNILAFDYRPDILIKVIDPGAIRTAAPKKPEVEKRMRTHTTLEHLDETEVITGAVL